MPRERRPNRRGRRIRAVVALVVALLLPPSLILADSAWTTATHEAHHTQVMLVSRGTPEAPTYRSDAVAVFLNGLGLDVSRRQARALAPSVGQYGRVYALEYASVFDPVRAADALADAIALPGDEKRPVHLTVFTSSMGDVRGLEIIASLAERHPETRVVGFVVNTGPGPGKRTRVRGGPAVQQLLDQSCSPFVPGSVTLGVLEVVNQALQNNVADPRTAAEAYRAGTQYRGRVLVNQLCSLTRPSAVNEPPLIPFSVYLSVAHPLDDVVVDVESAYHDWQDLIPSMQLRRVEGATHDNFHFRPDLFNPLLLDDLLPKIRSAQRLAYPSGRAAGNATIDRSDLTASGPHRPV